MVEGRLVVIRPVGLGGEVGISVGIWIKVDVD